MNTTTFRVVKCPTEEHALLCRLIVNKLDFPSDTEHAQVTVDNRDKYLMSIAFDNPYVSHISRGQIGFSSQMRKNCGLLLNQDVTVEPFYLDDSNDIKTIRLSINEVTRRNNGKQVIQLDSDRLATEFLNHFNNRIFSPCETIMFSHAGILLTAIVHDIEAKMPYGFLSSSSSNIIFETICGRIRLTGKSRVRQPLINPEWDFSKLGIGGLDGEFSGIFRRAFASRVFPSEVIEKLGMTHVRGILLYGPPGTGKTLIARQIGKMLNVKEIQVVNGPEILDKYVGESESKVRKLFAAAEEEERQRGPDSGLHIVIFDEIDAICKKRGSVSGNVATTDTIVNQLLSKLDGVKQLNNILVIGMTNRKDMIDEALLRPGCLEVQMEIGLPDESGREQILNIHTETMRLNNKLTSDVNIHELAQSTKNFSGAELVGLVRAAQSVAMNRLIKATNTVEVVDSDEQLQICMSDFRHALGHDVRPAYGSSIDDRYFERELHQWGDMINRVLTDGQLIVSQIVNSDSTYLMTMLLEGLPSTGKTTLAATIAKNSNFPFIRLCTPDEMIGYTDSAKCQIIKKIFDDAYKTPLSCIIIDDIERLVDYVQVGPRFNNLVLQALLVLLKKEPPKGHKLLIIGTTSRKDVLTDFEMLPLFRTIAHVSSIHTLDQLMNVITMFNIFTDSERDHLRHELGRQFGRLNVCIGIKNLITLIDIVKQVQVGDRVDKLITLLTKLCTG